MVAEGRLILLFLLPHALLGGEGGRRRDEGATVRSSNMFIAVVVWLSGSFALSWCGARGFQILLAWH
jgi:hypothetical protein